MISPEEKQFIIDAYGKHYCKAVIEDLEKKGIKPLRAEKFSNSQITLLVCGEWENLELEKQVMSAANTRRKKQLRDARKREQLTQK